MSRKSAPACKVMALPIAWPALVMLFLLGAVVAAGAQPSPARRIIVEIDGDQVQWNYQMQATELHGNVRIYLQVEGQPEQRAVIRADRAAANLQSGQIEAQKGITVGTPYGVLTGEYLQLNAHTEEFCLKQARSVVDLTPAAPPAVHGYAFGEEIGLQNDIVYIIRGQITTCNRQRPHYALTAKRIEYYPARRHFKIKGAALYLYGVKIPLIPSFSFDVSEEEEDTPGILPLPGYSSQDKLYLPYRFIFSGDDSPWHSEVFVRLTQGRGIRLMSTHEYTRGKWQAAARLTQTEDFYDDLDNRVTLHRRPQVTLTRFAADRAQADGWQAGVSLGNIVEDLKTDEKMVSPRPDVREQFAALTLRYDRHSKQRRQGQGKWYGLRGRQAFYSTGEDYRDLALTAGVGGRLGNDLLGSLTATQHITGGRSPFLFDTVNIKTELQPALEARLSERWAMSALGRYDAGAGKLRDYELELSRRAHCLTWTLHYRFIGQGLGIRVAINGLTGDAAPYPQQSKFDKLYTNTQKELVTATGEE